METIIPITNEDGSLIAIVYNDMKRRAQVFYAVKEMGMEEIKDLLEKNNAKNITKS